MEKILDIDVSLDYDAAEIERALRRKYRAVPRDYRLYHRSLDARRDPLRFHLKIACPGDFRAKTEEFVPPRYELPRGKDAPQVVVVGAGPAGLFAAHVLVHAGAHVTVLERGGAMPDRVLAVRRFTEEGVFDPESNISFGEGGAGTFSDGKLTSRSKDARKEYVKEVLVAHGAKEDILFEAKPHIGTDHMRRIILHLRRSLEEKGAVFRFGTRVEGLLIEGGCVRGVETRGGTIRAEVVLLAVGNAARDTFLMLHHAGVQVLPKPFSVGVRIEHAQGFVDRCQFRRFAGHPRLLAGEYALTAKTDGGGVYSFCMCPGGIVVPSASEPEHLSVNGMSYHDRALPNANAAIVASVPAQDDVVASIEYQREIERRAYVAGGGGYRAPAIHVRDFLEGCLPKTQSRIVPSYPLGVRMTQIDDLFAQGIADRLRLALLQMERKMPGFADDAVLTAAETKTSSPVRMERGEDFSSNFRGLYVCGEGAGFAGGIVSAALDGLKCAERILGCAEKTRLEGEDKK